ncbi:hypothetical protein [Primorskyibacter sedentarius]|uniref:hypothetical protein n=1 Tax=Primorskyibacter sedentarius TaxID=745311 RepID=UPI003EC1171A
MLRLRLIIPICLVAACSNEASHLPNPLLLPGQAIATGIGNARYNARRAQVSAHVAQHHSALIAEITVGGGPRMTEAMDRARVPEDRRPVLLRRLREDIVLYRADAEALVVALMVHGG